MEKVFILPSKKDLEDLSNEDSENVLNLIVQSCENLDEDDIHNILPSFPNLQSLTLLKLPLEMENFIIRDHKSLQSLTLNGSELRRIIFDIESPLPLERLVCSKCFNLTLDCGVFERIGEGLLELDLSSVLVLSDEDIEDFSKYWKNLEILNLSESDNSHGLRNVSLKHIAQHCTHLEKLQLNHCKGYDDRGLIYLKELTNLKVLELFKCEQMNQKALDILLSFPNLEELRIGLNKNIFATDEDGVIDALVNHPKIHSLDISFIHLKEKNFVALGNRFQSLCISWTLINDYTLKKMAMSKERKVEILDLSNCRKLTDWAIKDFVKFARFPLKKLIIKGGLEKTFVKGLEMMKEKWGNECKIITNDPIDVFDFTERRKRRRRRKRAKENNNNKQEEEKITINIDEIEFTEEEKTLFQKHRFQVDEKRVYCEVMKMMNEEEESRFILPSEYIVWCINSKKTTKSVWNLMKRMSEIIEEFNFGKIELTEELCEHFLTCNMFIHPELNAIDGAPIIWVKEGEHPEYVDPEKERIVISGFLLWYEKILRKFPSLSKFGAMAISDFSNMEFTAHGENAGAFKRKYVKIQKGLPMEFTSFISIHPSEEIKKFIKLFSRGYQYQIFDDVDHFKCHAKLLVEQPQKIPDLIGGNFKIDILDIFVSLFDLPEEKEMLKKVWKNLN